MYKGNVEARKHRLVRAYIAASRAGDAGRVVAVRKAFWRLVDATMDHGATARRLIGQRE